MPRSAIAAVLRSTRERAGWAWVSFAIGCAAPPGAGSPGVVDAAPGEPDVSQGISEATSGATGVPASGATGGPTGSATGSASSSSGGAIDGSMTGATTGSTGPTGPSGGAGAVDASGGSGVADASGGAGASGATGPGDGSDDQGLTQADGGTGCPSLPAAADAYARWPMPNPVSSHLPNPAHTTDRGDGTVLDDVTGLLWQKAVSSSQAFAWAAAKAYCTHLTLAGQSWHLPTRIELLSIVDFTKNPGIDATAFPSLPGGKYHWTSTPWVVSQIATKPQDAWMVNFSDSGLDSNAASQTSVEYARCVSSPAGSSLPQPHYLQVGPGEVQDTATKLIWAQASQLTPASQADAVAACTSLWLNGHAWRLPSISELSTLVDDNPDIKKVSPAIDGCVFHDTPSNAYYIASSSIGASPWAINYEDGFTSHAQTQGLARCVR